MGTKSGGVILRIKSDTIHERDHGEDSWQPTRLLHPWDYPGKSTGVGCHCVLQQAYTT